MRLFWLIPIFVAASIAVGFWAWQRGEISQPPEEPAEFAGLDPEKQKHIWDAEHFTFEIETHVGKKLIEALRSREANELSPFFREDFSGTVPKANEPQRKQQAGVSEIAVQASAATGEAAALPSAEFSEHLIEAIADVKTIQSGRFRVLKIFADEDETLTPARWRLSVLLTVGGKNAAGGPCAYEASGTMQVRFSDDEDITALNIFEKWVVEKEAFRTSPAPLMEEATRRVGLHKLPITDNWTAVGDPVRQYRFQSAVADYNQDGRLDVAVVTADDQGFLLEHDPQTGRFEDVTEKRGLPSRGFLTENRAYLATWIDFDNDGDPDLLWGETLYRNESGKTFEPVEDNGGLQIGYNPMGSVVADYDADGALDLYVLYQHKPNTQVDEPPSWVNDDKTGAENQLWRNRGDGTFEERTHSAKVTGGTRHTFAATWLHANDDHYPDLYVANDFARNSLFINQGDGTFADAAEQSDVGDFATSMGVASGDINGDGRPEIYVANMFSKMGRRIIAQVNEDDYPEGIYEQLLGSCAGNRLYTSNGDLKQFRDLSEDLGVNAVGWAFAPAMADFDGDGWLDLYATAGFLSFNRHKPDG